MRDHDSICMKLIVLKVRQDRLCRLSVTSIAREAGKADYENPQRKSIGNRLIY